MPLPIRIQGVFMKIERVDDTTIKCYISLDEMEKYQVEYTDFISRSEKAQELMHEIIRQAHDEVGYQPPKFAFEMQIMMVPEQGMVLTFSEKEPFDVHDSGKVEAFIEHLKQFAGKLAEYKDKIAAKNGVPMPGIPTPGSTKSDNGTKGDRPRTAKEGTGAVSKEAQVNEAVFAFAYMSQIMELADELPANLRVNSAVYKMDGDFFLHIEKGAASYDRYSRACVQALEFGELYRAGEGCDELLKEHGECIIAEKALKKLKG